MSFSVGENIGPYRIIEQLGQGGMATVFKAYHASLDRYVALKVLHPAINQDPNFEARFQREARVVAKLEHQNIVPVYDYAEHEKRPYLIMKFVEGQTLKARMDKGVLSSDEITRIVDAVGSALAYAHKQGVLHRDIKPSNVLLTNDGQIYLADFGLARMAQAGESTLSSDMMMGTPQYISPEQAMGKADLDSRTDLYSFGVMLYEMVVGKVPFSADTPFSIIHDHIYTPLPLPRTVNADVPEQVERVLLKALAKERDDRFEDSMKLVAAFKQAWSEAGVPVQRSDVNASQVGQTVVNPMVPGSESINAAGAATKVADVEEKVGEPETVLKSNKKRSPWMWVSAALLIILFIGALAVIRNRNERLQARPQDVVSSPAPGIPANQPVDQQPNEPNSDLHLDQALAAWSEHDMQRSMDEVNQLVTLRGDQTEFLMEAGTQLFDAGQYIGSAFVYARAAQGFRDRNQQLPIDVRQRFEESFYLATAMDGFPLYLPLDAVRERDPALAFFGQSRYALLHGNMDLARRNLDELRRIQPDWYLTQILTAEVMFAEGTLLEPRKILQDLTQSPHVPDWVKRQVETLMNEHQ